MAEKAPLYAVTEAEDENLRKYYGEIDLDDETFAALNATSKAFILEFVRQNY